MSVNFLEETRQAKRERDDIFKLMKKKPTNQEYIFSGRLFFINEDDIKTFPIAGIHQH